MIEKGTDSNYAVKKLIDGGIVAIPTETVYGLACNALNTEAVRKVFEIKNRPKNDPLICHTDSVNKIKKYVIDFPKEAEIVAETFWPGPITILLKKNNLIPDITTSNSDYVAFRIPDNKITLNILKELDFPLAAPSANKFEYISPTNTDHVSLNFKVGIDYILDGGICSVGIESTIISFEKNKIMIHRLGGVTLEEIKKKAGNCLIKANKKNLPGQFKKHYSPNKKVYVGDIKKLYKKFKNKKVGILCYDKKYNFIDENNQILLTEKSSLNEASKNFYSSLYILDNLEDIDLILTSYIPNSLIGRSINDRIKKCSENE
jgi:L-threonylcarbamoyladenylate synthase|tara:strand:- start:817 stop:1770 length:954 start_codon:yes stop_codon:yes gene_type:complete